MPDEQLHRRGRRDPGLLQPDGPAGPSIDVDEHTEVEEQHELARDSYVLLDEGDLVTVSATMPVILEGHQRESYFGTKVTTRVREDEPAEVAAERGRIVALGSILEQVEEAEEALRQYEEAQAARVANATR